MKNEHSTLPEKIEAGETLAGVQLCPFGEFPNGKTVQLCDEVAFNKIAANFAADGAREILCDFEHKSEDPSLTSDTAAAAWISNVHMNKERGLVGDLKFTDLGAEAVTNRRLRFLSPVWTLDADGRPDRLKSVALTNKPNIPVACVLNRAPQPVTQTVEEQKGNPAMDKIKELLGLAPEATDEDVVAAVKALQEQIAAANKEKEEAEADSFAEEHKEVCNKEALKSAYLMNKDAAKALVAGFVKPAAPAQAQQTLLNKETVATPASANPANTARISSPTPQLARRSFSVSSTPSRRLRRRERGLHRQGDLPRHRRLRCLHRCLHHPSPQSGAAVGRDARQPRRYRRVAGRVVDLRLRIIGVELSNLRL